MLRTIIICYILLCSAQTTAQQPSFPGGNELGSNSYGSGRTEHLHATPLGNESGSTLQTLAATGWDTTSAFLHGLDGGEVRAMLVDGDNLYIGGDFRYFDTVECYHIVQYNRTTHRWSKMGNGFSGEVRALAIHNGKLYAGGAFSRAGFNTTTTLNYLAAWDGTKWASVGNGMSGSVEALAFVGNDLYVGGGFTKAGSVTANYLAKWNGSSWDNLGLQLNSSVYTLLGTGDSLIIGGAFYDGTQSIRGLALWKDNTLSTIGGGIDAVVYSLALFENKLWVGGDYYKTWDDQIDAYGLATYDGTSWQAFGTGVFASTDGIVYNLTASGDSLIALGAFTKMGSTAANSIAVWKNGSWHTLGTGLYGNGRTATLFDGDLYLGGRFSTANDKPHTSFVRVGANGWNDIGKGIGITDGYNTLNVSALAANDDYVFIGGSFTSIGGLICNHLAAWNKHTKKWETLGSGIDGDVNILRIYGDDLYVGGPFLRANNESMRKIARWNISTKKWYPMGDGSIRSINGIAANNTGVYASVAFPYNGSFANNIGKWNGTSWEILPGNFNGFINAIEAVGSTLYMGGSFTRVDNTKLSGFAIYDGSSWYSPGSFNGAVNSIVAIGNNVYASGAFTQIDGNTTIGISMWDGASWGTLGSDQLNDYPLSIAAQGSTLIAGGYFTKIGSLTVNHIATWNGSSWNALAGGIDNTVLEVAADNSAIYAGGYFGKAGTVASYRLAAFLSPLDGVAPQPIAISSELQSYPNPFSVTTTLRFKLNAPQVVQIEVSDMLGRVVQRFPATQLSAGDHEKTIDASGFARGTYQVRAQLGKEMVTRSIIVQ